MGQRAHFMKNGGASLYSDAILLYSLRDMGVGYSGVHIRVRRESDSTEQDFYLVSGGLDASGIATFCGASIGRIVRLYNQGTLGGYWENNSGATEPRIYDGSAIHTSGGIYATSHQATSETLVGDWTSGGSWFDDFSAFVVTDGAVANSRPIIGNPASSGIGHFQRRFAETNFRHGGTAAQFGSTPIYVGNRFVLSAHFDLSAESIQYFYNGVDQGSLTMTNDWDTFTDEKMRIGYHGSYFQEAVYFDEIRSDLEALIIAEQNAYYSVY